MSIKRLGIVAVFSLLSPGGQDDHNMEIYHQVKHRLQAPHKIKKVILYWLLPVCGRTGVRLRDYQYFSDAWINQFSYPWSTVARVRGPLHATCTSPIMHLICPPKFCISIVFNSSWTAKILRRNENKGYANFFLGGGQIKWIMGDAH